MPRRRRAKAETALISHRTPDLAALLEEAKTCELAPLRRFLAAGGRADVLVPTERADGSFVSAPLLFTAIINSARLPDLRSTIELLLDAGANVNAFLVDDTLGELSILMSACQTPFSIEPLKILLQHGADVCLQTLSTGLTALHVAAACGFTDRCQLLLEANRRTLELCASGGRSAIFEAAIKGHLPVVELLHKGYGADLFAVDGKGWTLLHVAVRSQPLLAYLIRNGLDINAVNSSMQTPLHIAAFLGRAAAAKMLLEHGAINNSNDNRSSTPLHIACRTRHADVAELLLNSGLQAAATVNAAGLTLLMQAVTHGDLEVVAVLLQHGADVLAVTSEGMTALHRAAYSGGADIARVLLQHGADVNASDVNGLTPLMSAVLGSNTECMQLLLDAGAELHATNVRGEPPLLYAAQHGSVECVQLLLEAGADLSVVSALSCATVLHAAAINEEYPEVLQVLLQRSDIIALINSVATRCDCCGRTTPLMWCSQPAHVKLLLAAAADAHMTSDTDDTCLHVAAAHKRPASVVCLLIKAGVNLHAVNSEGKTAAQVATDCGNTLTASLLTRAAMGP
jgi:ankyrin